MKKLILFAFLVGGMLATTSIAFAQNATLYFTPAAGSYTPGQTFRATIMVDTKGINVNAVAAYFTYPADKLDAIGVDTAGSAMTLFAEQTAGGGRVDISGGKPTPGFSGIQKIASVDFRVKTGVSGSVTLTFASDAAVLSDANNQNILSLPNSGSATFQITQGVASIPPPSPEPTPPPPPDGESTSFRQDDLEISEVKAEQVGVNSIRISWKTNKQASAQVAYGVMGVYDFSILVGATGQEHSVLITGLGSPAGGEEYQFQVKSVTAAGEVAVVGGLTLEDLAQGQGEDITIRDIPEEGGFLMNTTSLILFVGLPIVVFLIIAFLFIQRMRRRGQG